MILAILLSHHNDFPQTLPILLILAILPFHQSHCTLEALHSRGHRLYQSLTSRPHCLLALDYISQLSDLYLCQREAFRRPTQVRIYVVQSEKP